MLNLDVDSVGGRGGSQECVPAADELEFPPSLVSNWPNDEKRAAWEKGKWAMDVCLRRGELLRWLPSGSTPHQRSAGTDREAKQKDFVDVPTG